jgi:hypothetical protein
MAREPHLPPQGDPNDGDPNDDDPMEVWGRRIGRSLAVVACIVLAAYLLLTYLR